MNVRRAYEMRRVVGGFARGAARRLESILSLAGWPARVSLPAGLSLQRDRSKSFPRDVENVISIEELIDRRRLGRFTHPGIRRRRISASKITALTCFPRTQARGATRTEREKEGIERRWEEEGGRLGEGEREKARSGVDEQTTAVPSKSSCGACARTHFCVATLRDWSPAPVGRASIFLLGEDKRTTWSSWPTLARSRLMHSAPMRTPEPQICLLSRRRVFQRGLIREESADGWM